MLGSWAHITITITRAKVAATPASSISCRGRDRLLKLSRAWLVSGLLGGALLRSLGSTAAPWASAVISVAMMIVSVA